MKKLFLILAIVGLIVAVVFPGPMMSAIGKAVAGVSFSLWYIWMLFGDQPQEKSGGTHQK
jgi:uncharacterized MnhB-related membrane protein